MAEQKNTVVFDIQIESDKSASEIARLTKLIMDQKKEWAKLNKEVQESNGENKEAAVAAAKLSEQIRQNTQALSNEKKAIVANDNSLDALRATINRLNAERNKLNTSLPEEKKRYEELTSELNDLRGKLNEASKAAGDFRMNVGNYTNSILEAAKTNDIFGEKVTQFINIIDMSNSAFTALNITIKANPLGLLLTALGAIVGLLAAFFTQTKAGRDMFADFGNTVKGALTYLLNTLGKVGAALYDYIVNPGKAAEDAWSGFKQVMQDGVLVTVAKGVDKMQALAKETKAAADAAREFGQMKRIWEQQILDADLLAAKYTKIAEANRKLRDDERLSLEERLAANEASNKAEIQRRDALRQSMLLQQKVLEQELMQRTNTKLLSEARKLATIEELRAMNDVARELEMIEEDYESRSTENLTEEVSIRKEHENAILELQKQRLAFQIAGEQDASLKMWQVRSEMLAIERKQALLNLQAGTAERLAVEQDYINQRKALESEYREWLKDLEKDMAKDDEAAFDAWVDTQIKGYEADAEFFEGYVDRQTKALEKEDERAKQAEKDRAKADAEAIATKEDQEKKRSELINKGEAEFKSLTETIVQQYGEQSAAAQAAIFMQKAYHVASVLTKLPDEIAGYWSTYSELGPTGIALATALTAMAVVRASAAVTDIQNVGFANGGYTGDGGKYEPAGIVHKGEYVMPKETVSRLGVSYLDGISKGYAMGGFVGPQPGPAPGLDAMNMLSSSIQAMNIQVAVTDIQKATGKYVKVRDIANR